MCHLKSIGISLTEIASIFGIPYSTKISRELNFAISRMRQKIAKLMYRELSSRAEHVAYLEETRAKKKACQVGNNSQFFKVKREEEKTCFADDFRLCQPRKRS